MKHYKDEELILYYYGDSPSAPLTRLLSTPLGARRRRAAIERHLDECATCAANYRSLTDMLSLVTAPEPPERGDQYPLEVWQRIRHRLAEPDARSWTSWLQWNRLALAGAALAIVLAVVIAPRMWPREPAARPVASAGREAPADDSRQRILISSVADHLDRSERVLTDIMNAGGRSDISDEQRWAGDLLAASRIYRQDAEDAGEQSVAAVLDDLERSLLEIVHSPSRISAEDLEQIRRRIDAAALLFKVRVMGDELRQREQQPGDVRTRRTSTRSIS